MEADALVALLIIILAGAALAGSGLAAAGAAARLAAQATRAVEKGNESAQTLLEASVR